jgi:AcrR family transcriptional regulator
MSPRSKESSKQKKAQSRSAILSASLELFAKKGFSATTTDEIAMKAKVSKGLIFSHFHTKQDILLAIMDEKIIQFLPKLDETNDTRHPKEQFFSFIDSWMDLLKNEPLLIQLSLRLNLDDDWRKILHKKGKQYLELYLSSMRKLLVRLGSKKPDLDCYLLAVFFDGVEANYIAAPELFPIDAMKEHLLEILLSHWGNHRGNHQEE